MPMEPERDPLHNLIFHIDLSSIEEERRQQESGEMAAALVDRLFNEDEAPRQYSPDQAREAAGKAGAVATRQSPVFQADVEYDIHKFSSQAETYSVLGYNFPCLSIAQAEPIPIDIFPHMGLFPWPVSYQPDPYDYLRFWVGQAQHYLRHGDALRNLFSERAKVEYVEAHPQEARGFFRNGLLGFMTTRFIGASQFDQSPPPKGAAATSGGLQFCVITSTGGLRVHYSPAYFINRALVFGSKTPQVCESIKPGRYIFGVAGPGIPDVKFSAAEFDIPYSKQADLLDL